MKKRIIVISFFILFILGLLIIINNKDNKIYTDIDGIKYAILVDGESSTSFPNGNYKVEVDCTNADAYWDNIAHKIIVKNITGDVSCDIEFNSITSSDYLNSYIINLCNGTSNMGICDATTASNQGSGQLVNENGLRYEGSNPNNYLFFNDELWRIIGVFSTAYDSDNDGTADSTDDLVKIIREESIGGLVWDKYNSNKWPNSSLYHLLNEQYYDWETNKINVDNNCFTYYADEPGKCDYSIVGIKDEYRDMIERVKLYSLGCNMDISAAQTAYNGMK